MDDKLLKKFLEYASTDQAFAVLFVKKHLAQRERRKSAPLVNSIIEVPLSGSFNDRNGSKAATHREASSIHK